jgi:hypothetical protein
VLRGHAGEIEHVLVLTTVGAPRRRRVAGRRARAASPDPAAVATARATIVSIARLEEPAARAWLDGADAEGEAASAIAVLNRVLHLQRVAAADHATREVSRDQALVVRIGYGGGEQVADGHWAQARELPLPRIRSRREAALRPQERLSALLGTRDAALACEELTLRARADVDAGRLREAALQLGVALEAALAELEPWREQTGLAERLGELRARRDAVAAAAGAALRGGLDEEHIETVRAVLGRVEAALRARTAGQRL